MKCFRSKVDGVDLESGRIPRGPHSKFDNQADRENASIRPRRPPYCDPLFFGMTSNGDGLNGIDFRQMESFNALAGVLRPVGAGGHESGSTMSSVQRNSKRILGFVLLAICANGDAQVPPHPPGTVCYTPQFWCWMQQPAYPGTPCFCPSPYGLVRGTVG